jgi:hypothetical protein
MPAPDSAESKGLARLDIQTGFLQQPIEKLPRYSFRGRDHGNTNREQA